MSSVGDEIRPFRIETSPEALADLRTRLLATRWPDRETVDDWSQGIPLAYLQDVCAHWADGYDWPARADRLNSFPQYLTEIDGLDIHFLHVPSPHPGAQPLLVTHGWPGSIAEFQHVIGPLTDPPAHGGAAADAFHVVCPSIPGYGFSGKPTTTGWGVEKIASAWSTLMSRLGYERFFAQGGDWGAAITTQIGMNDPAHCIAIHLNMVSAPPDRATLAALTEQEQAALADLDEHRRTGTGYSKQQSTRPQTVGYGLVDSPAALAAWILEKFHAWTDNDGTPESAVGRDELLDNVMLYWLPGTGASSARLYWESFEAQRAGEVLVPVGCSLFPKEIYRPSTRWVRAHFGDRLVHCNELERGGHFAAFEQPTSYVDEIRTCFRPLRG